MVPAISRVSWLLISLSVWISKRFRLDLETFSHSSKRYWKLLQNWIVIECLLIRPFQLAEVGGILSKAGVTALSVISLHKWVVIANFFCKRAIQPRRDQGFLIGWRKLPEEREKLVCLACLAFPCDHFCLWGRIACIFCFLLLFYTYFNLLCSKIWELMLKY